MKIKIGEVLLLSSITDALLYETSEKGKSSRSMPFRVKNKLIKALGKIERELKPYEEERVNLVKKYGSPTEEGSDNLQVDEDKLKDFYKELQEIVDTETEIQLSYCLLTEEDVDSIEGDVNVEEAAIRAFQKFMMCPENNVIVE